MSEPFIAEIRIFAGNFAPRGWAMCDGQVLPIAQNVALFSLIGTTYGGDGRNTTALPDLRGRAPMHAGRGPGLSARRLGEQVGVPTVTLDEAQLPRHGHGQHATGGADDNDPGPDVVPATADGGALYAPGNPGAEAHPLAVGHTGGGEAHENCQPYLGLNFIIALVGLYPARG